MLLFDLETDGLLDTVSKIHCMVVRDTETGIVSRYTQENIEEGLYHLQVGTGSLMTGIGGHNVIKYDIPVIQKLYPWFTVDKARVLDTLVATRLVWSNLKDIDNGLLKRKKIPGYLYGSHKLEAWGYRMGLQKGEYADDFKARMGDDYEEGMEWREFSQEMLDYCVLDVEVTSELYKRITDKEYSQEALELEHRIAWLMAQQERNGFPFDATKAAMLYAKLAQRRGELERELKNFFRYWFAPDGLVTPKVASKARGTTVGVPYTKIKIVEFNPSSRDHIANRLTKLYGWKPEVFTPGGKPKVDEDVMAGLAYPPAELLTEYLMVAKRISQLAEGDQAWLKVVKKDGRIHGSVNPNGAVTGRATHSYPNISQVPASGAPYGEECRELFCVPPGWQQVGADASGLELRCLSHFMARYDGGKYGDVLLKGDIHWANVQSMGLTSDTRDKEDKLHSVYRDGSKTFIYGFLYGAGDEKAGKIVYGLVLRAKGLGLPYQHLLQMFFGGVENPGPAEFKAAGKKLKGTFLKKTPALKKLIEAVRESAKRGFLIGLDKRHLHVRSQHAALNVLLQAAGAILCKMWLVMVEDELQAAGLKHGWDGDYAFMAWSHDECQIACRTPEVVEIVRKTAEACVVKAGDHFNFRIPLAGESKVGTNWSQTH